MKERKAYTDVHEKPKAGCDGVFVNDRRPTTNDRRDRQPTTNDQRPTIDDRRSMTDDQLWRHGETTGPYCVTVAVSSFFMTAKLISWAPASVTLNMIFLIVRNSRSRSACTVIFRIVCSDILGA